MTQEFLKEVFNYENGKFVWKERPFRHFSKRRGCLLFNSRYAGKSISKGRNVVITYLTEAVRFKTHCLVYLYHYGYLPSVVDHVDSDNLNHKIENLQPATPQLNTAKASMWSHNTSGYRGVHRCVRNNKLKWKVEIKVSGTSYYIGRFDNIHYAAAMYNEVSKLLFGKYCFVNDSHEVDKITINIHEMTSCFFRKHLPKIMKELDELYGKNRDRIPDRTSEAG